MPLLVPCWKTATDIYSSALANNHIRIVQAALLGSILVNLLLILGTAVLVGSIKYQELVHNTASAQTLACLLALSVFSMLIPVNDLPYEELNVKPTLISYRALSTTRSAIRNWQIEPC
jgi:calcium/proton exchanger cax